MSSFFINNIPVPLGTSMRFNLPVAHLFDYTEMTMSLQVIRGKIDGPTVFISGAVHGDEIIGTEIIRRIAIKKELKKLCGTLILIPIVNPFGYNNNSRYLPDRRDLNRSFPGSVEGSLAARIANTFVTEIVKNCDYGIDIHTGAIHRVNYPQVRLDFANSNIMHLAEAFGTPIIINSPNRPNTLRAVAHDNGVETILYEVGEALRYEEHGIKIGVNGVLNVLRTLKMLPYPKTPIKPISQITANASYWLRAPESGIVNIRKKLGQFVKTGEVLARIYDPFGKCVASIVCSKPGVIIGMCSMPLVNQGNAMFHIAVLDKEDLLNDSGLVLDQDIDIENELWYQS